MQRWEYCEVHGRVVTYFRVGVSERVEHRVENTEALVAHLGREGWEAVTYLGGGACFLKRPIQP